VKALAIASQKGGVGKTTVALNLAYALAARGCRTLLVDTDLQGAIGLSLAGQARHRPGLAECLAGRLAPGAALLPTRLPELSLLPFGQPPDEELDRWGQDLGDGSALGALLDEIAGGFDLAVLDTPSGLQGPTLAALRAADFALVPLQAEPLALRSMTQVLQAVGRLREQGARVSLAAFLLTMLQSREQFSLAVAQEAWGRLPSELVLEAFVPRDPVFLRASALGVPVGLLSRRPPPAAMVFDQIAAELEPILGLAAEGAGDEPIPLLD
jgi:chromosome partitioning protein